MTRLGWWLLLGFAVVIAGFFLLARIGHAPAPVSTTVDTAAGPAPTMGGAAPIIPVQGVQPAQLTDSWGQERGGGTRGHQALDIMAPRGTPVLAATSGTVEKLFESKDGGHTIYVRRDDAAWQDYYAHLDSYAPGLSEGMKVAQGEVLGAVGSTGSASEAAPHLHYEIHAMAGADEWWQGRAINPYPILAGQAADR
jgi:murein DD-endopeptidase MepM/ murein hydrolase activator NlpD